MSSRSGFEVEGLRALVRDLQALGVEVDDLKDAFQTLSQEGARIAAAEAPKKSGRLAGDIRGNRAKSKAAVTAGRASVPYAGPINYGWASRGIAPSGFMQKADTVMQPIAIRQLEDEINKQIAKKGLK